MGPHCPECDTVFPWTAGELEEQVLIPRVYVCAACGALFVLEPDEVAALQVRLRTPEPEPEPAPAQGPTEGSPEIVEDTQILQADSEPEPDLSHLGGHEAAERALDLGERLREVGARLYEKLASLSGEWVSDADYRRLFDIEQRTWRDAVKKGSQAIAHLSRAPVGAETERLRAQARDLLDEARAHLRPR